MDVAVSIEHDIPARVTGANRIFIRAVIARAITAAVAAEREACAEWADATADHYDAKAIIDAIGDVAPNRAAESALRGFANAIRARNTPC